MADNELGGRTKRVLPQCKYSIHKQSLDGPIIENARLGDKVLSTRHNKWKIYKNDFISENSNLHQNIPKYSHHIINISLIDIS